MKNILFVFLVFLIGTGCGSTRPKVAFDPLKTPPAPDYAKLDNWAAHPDKADPADRTPSPDLKDEQATAAVDVIFLHPTTYTGARRSDRDWNASLDDAGLNTKTDNGSILFQASIFNGAGRVYAPRYRQAHLHTFFAKDDKKSAQQALDLAYEDIKAAFAYYLKNWNHGRPFIIAGHSQGGRHAMFLVRDLIENTPLEKQLVAVYIIGWPVQSDFFKTLKPCQSAGETDCFCTWRTWERNSGLDLFRQPSGVVCTNPLTWTTKEQDHAPASANKGAVLRPFNTVYPQITDAEIHNGYLLSTKPHFRGSFLFPKKNFHIGDMNLFYVNIRENAQLRVKRWTSDVRR
jgi:hypothetical protein